jgi:hypothetical protein
MRFSFAKRCASAYVRQRLRADTGNPITSDTFTGRRVQP